MSVNDAPEKKTRQTRQFHCEILVGDREHADQLARDIEQAYQTINDTALADDMVILNTQQTPVGLFHPQSTMPQVMVFIVAQRVPRATLREMEMRAQIGQNVGPFPKQGKA